MRALLDANIFLSFLLDRTSNTPPVSVVEAAFNGHYTLLVTARVIDETREKSQTKPYLAARIKQHQVNQLVKILDAVAMRVPELQRPYPEVGPDRKDDYLYAHAITGQADFLVSGDKHVRAVSNIGDVKIVSPGEFLQILRQAGRLAVSPEND
jgi:putative PIN family toxin of toxin-antitoxin system